MISLFFVLTNTNETKPLDILTISAVDKDTVRVITISRQKKSDVLFEKKDNGWVMLKPYQIRAHENRIATMLNLLSTRSLGQLNVRENDLNKYELDMPQLSLQLGEEVFYFGNINPLQNRRYVMAAHTIHLIDDRLFPQLQQDTTFFISNKLLPAHITITEIIYPAHKLYNENEQWQLTPVINNPVIKNKELVSNWYQARASKIEKLDARESNEIILIKTKRNITYRFEIIQSGPQLKLARTDLGFVYTINQSQNNQLTPEI